MNNYEILKKYINDSIPKVISKFMEEADERGISGNLLETRVEKATRVYNSLTSGNYNYQDFGTELDEIIKIIYPKIDKFSETFLPLLEISSLDYDSPQKAIATSTVNDVISLLGESLSNWRLEYNALKVKMMSIVSELNSYYALVTENGLTKTLKEDKLNGLLDFINESDIDEEIKRELIIDICHSNLMFLNNSEDIRGFLPIVERNIDDVYGSSDTLSVYDDFALAEEDDSEVMEDDPSNIELSSLEKKTIGRIKDIINKLKKHKKISEVGDTTVLLLQDVPLTFSDRKQTYMFNEDYVSRWNVIYYDICNLINTKLTKDNKEDIFKIYEYVLEEYDKLLMVIQRKNKIIGNLQNAGLKKNERDSISKLLEKAEMIRDNYLREKSEDKGYSHTYAYFTDALENFKHIWDSYNETYSLISMEENVSEEELKSSITLLKKDVKAIREGLPLLQQSFKEISKYYEISPEEKEKEADTLEPVSVNTSWDNLKTGKNLFVMLNDSDGVSFISKDHAGMLNGSVEDKDVRAVVTGLGLFYKLTSLELTASEGRSHHIEGEGKEYYRLRSSDARISYRTLSLSEEKRTQLMAKYGNNNRINIILLLGTYIEHDVRVTYSHFNGRISRERKNIEKLNKLFGSKGPFTPEEFSLATSLIEQSNDIYISLKDDPFKGTTVDKKKGRE